MDSIYKLNNVYKPNMCQNILNKYKRSGELNSNRLTAELPVFQTIAKEVFDGLKDDEWPKDLSPRVLQWMEGALRKVRENPIPIPEYLAHIVHDELIEEVHKPPEINANIQGIDLFEKEIGQLKRAYVNAVQFRVHHVKPDWKPIDILEYIE